MSGKKKEETQSKGNDAAMNDLLKERAYLKSKIAYSLGSLETINYLLKNDDPQILKQNLDHLRSTVNRVLEDLRKDF